jgi:hypothetical protein
LVSWLVNCASDLVELTRRTSHNDAQYAPAFMIDYVFPERERRRSKAVIILCARLRGQAPSYNGRTTRKPVKSNTVAIRCIAPGEKAEFLISGLPMYSLSLCFLIACSSKASDQPYVKRCLSWSVRRSRMITYYSCVQKSMYSASSSGHPRSNSYSNIANLHNYHSAILNYVVITIDMSASTAAHTLLNVLDQSESSSVADALSEDAQAKTADSEPVSNHTSNHTTLRKTRGTRRVYW